MATTAIYRTLSGATDNGKFTFSCWFKRSDYQQNGKLYANKVAATDSATIHIETDGIIEFMNIVSGVGVGYLKTDAKLQDNTSWYHLVCQTDYAQGSASDRMTMWINGVEQTSFSSSGYPGSSDTNMMVQDSLTDSNSIGANQADTNTYFAGCMSNVVVIYGEAYQATDFGEFDATDGIWMPKTDLSGLTFDSKSLWLKMEDSTDMDKDSSGNNITMTTAGNLIAVKDSPSNNFATWNNQWYIPSHKPNFLNTNNSMTMTGNTSVFWATSTIGAETGKYYSEHKLDKNDGYSIIGISQSGYALTDGVHNNSVIGSYADSLGYMINDGKMVIGPSSTESAYGNIPADGEVLGIAVDLDNKKFYVAIDGVWQNSADPSAGTGGFDFSALTTTSPWVMIIGDESGGYNDAWDSNYGNGYFGTTAITSAGTNAAGNGIFEFDVPTNFTAWCTRGINSF
jgi:hypothetical protein